MKDDGASSETFGFVTYKSRAVAQRAVTSLDGKPFDQKHLMHVVRLDELQSFEKNPNAAVATTLPLQINKHDDDYYWLMDEQCRDEFLIRYSLTESNAKDKVDKDETEVLWADMRGPPVLDYGGESQKLGRVNGKWSCWADGLVCWSPRGTYLTTMHEQGAKLWHGKGFRSEGWKVSDEALSLRFKHARVRSVLWSPNERYVCTWNGFVKNKHPERAFVIWDVYSGEEVRNFKQANLEDDNHRFVWSPDSRFLARIVSEMSPDHEKLDLIHIYEAATGFRLLEDRSIKALGARDLVWSPSTQALSLAWWSVEQKNVPLTVSVMRIPSKEYAKQRPLINLEGTKILWHPGGEFAAVYAEKLTKVALARKRLEANPHLKEKAPVGGGISVEDSICAGFQLEVYRVKSKDVPVDSLEIKDRILDMAWEPNSLRFALLTESSTIVRETIASEDTRYGPKTVSRVHVAYHVAFYSLGEKPGEITYLFNWTAAHGGTIPSSLHWSPRGETILFAALAGPTSASNQHGRFIFFDAERKKALAEVVHNDANGLSWDPSGRMLATFKSRRIENPPEHPRDTVTNGYVLWTFQGVRLNGAEKPRLFQFLWRPRVEGLLSEEETRMVVKDLKKHIARYQEEDVVKANRKKLLARLRKRKQRDEHRAFVQERALEWQEQLEERVSLNLVLFGQDEPAEGSVEALTTVEVVLSETVTVVRPE